jgi:microcystin-dependent protein
MITAWGGSTAPSGWLECNGQSTAPYPKLAAITGATVPDLRGEFIRGWDHGRGVDAGRAIRSFQADELKSHNHTVNDPGHRHPQRINREQDGDGSGRGGAENDPTTNFPVLTDFAKTGITIDAAGGVETRPRNISLMYIIKHD